MIIDGKDLIVGRLATEVAKKAMLGEDVIVLNCEDVVISGRKRFVIDSNIDRNRKGHHTQGPFIPKIPSLYVKRVIRGMLPYKQEKGRNAFQRIKCFNKVPAEFQGKEAETIKKADSSKLKDIKAVKIKEICKVMGGKI